MAASRTSPAAPAPPSTHTRLFALVGNPNSGKTTLFNSLTGLRQKVGNYPGVTVEKKTGRLRLPDVADADLIDLPGLYSLTPRSPDERIARDVLLGRRRDVAAPDGVVDVVDSANLERNLYLTSQVLDLGLPTVVVLTMSDVAEKAGLSIDFAALEDALGVSVCVVVAAENQGIGSLRNMLANLATRPGIGRRLWTVPEAAQAEVDSVRALLEQLAATPQGHSELDAIDLLMQDDLSVDDRSRWPAAVLQHVKRSRERLRTAGVDFSAAVVEARYAWVKQVCDRVLKKPNRRQTSLTNKIDRILMHRFWGYLIFAAVMTLVFQTIFSLAQWPMNAIGAGVSWLQQVIGARMPAGPLEDLIVNGVIAGVGTTITFLPQILLLFFFIALLEDTGYMARAAFLMDKLMSKVGLHGKSFIPLLSSFACAIPGIMATRTIDDRKSRLATILVAPLISCPARIPVYTLMIAAFIPNRPVFGVLTLAGLTMLAMYLLGTVAAFFMAWIFKKTLLKGVAPVFFLEMPPYHRPSVRTVLTMMLERAMLFLRKAGTIILSVSIVLWFLSSYPKQPAGSPPDQQLAHSFVGAAGRAIEPAIKPLGFDWRIGVSLVSSFVAREVFVSSMGIIYSVGDRNSDPDQISATLKDKLRADPKFSPLIAICVMIYYVLAMQCLSTVAVVKRETNGWKWPLFMTGYMTALAWIVTFGVYQVGTFMHWGSR